LSVTTKTKTGTRRDDGRVVLHVFVHPDVRRGLHVLGSLSDRNADDVLKELVGAELKRQMLPVPSSFLD
jgi:hypothetical protein